MARLRETGPGVLHRPLRGGRALRPLQHGRGRDRDLSGTGRCAPAFTPLDFAAYAARKPPTLSGGEQVLLALHCFSLSDYAAIGIDTALEQLDPDNRDQRSAICRKGRQGFSALLADNRLDLPGMAGRSELTGTQPGIRLRSRGATAHLAPCDPRRRSRSRTCRSAIRADATFSAMPTSRSSPARPIGSPERTAPARPRCSSCSRACSPRRRQRSTLDGKPYAPWRTGNRIFALATQNPDHQWCGATLAEDSHAGAASARARRSSCRPTTRWPRSRPASASVRWISTSMNCRWSRASG